MTRRSVVWIVVSSIVSVAVIVVTRLVFSKEVWAGLGQWVGGVGALFAAGVALWVSHQETRHRQSAEFKAARAAAHFVVATWEEGCLTVQNHGSEPVTQLRVVALHPPANSRALFATLELFVGPVFLPQGVWKKPVWTATTGAGQEEDSRVWLRAELYEIEIEFQDLAGNTWRRVGENPPTCKSRAKS